MHELTGDPADERVTVDRVAHAVGRSRTPADCIVLFRLVRELRPSTAIELGTCVGISAAYQCAAMELNGTGRLVTLEAFGGHVTLAEGTLAEAGITRAQVRHGRFEHLLPSVLDELAPVDYAFVDGHHVGQATLAYAAMIKPAMADGGVILFDDISFSDDMARAWETLRSDPDVAASIDSGRWGSASTGAGTGAAPGTTLRSG